MAKGQPGSVLQSLRTLFREGATTALTDSQLIDRFTAKRAESAEAALAAEAAFAALVDRHGAMVWGVCRRVLRDAHEAEDAFQATFLILVRKAGSVRVDASLGGWLYGVAHRVALRARADAQRRESTPHRADPRPSEDPSLEAEREDLGETLNEELDRLPAKYRCPLELCYLQGMTYDQAAKQLDWPVATVKNRLTKGRHRLRERLSRRGFAAIDAGAAAPFAGGSPVVVSPALVHSTILAANSWKAGAFPAAVTELTEEVLKMVLVKKLTLLAFGVLIVIGLGIGAVAQPAAKPRIPKAEPGNAATRPTEGANSKKAAANARWMASLPNGATIEVVGVSVHPSGRDTWWGPDGKPLAEAPCERLSAEMNGGDDHVSREVAVRITDLPADAEHHWWVQGAHGGSWGQAKLRGQPVTNLEQLAALVDRDQTTATVQFKVASGAWQTVQVWHTSPGALGRRPGTSFIFGQPIATKTGTALSVTHNIQENSVRLVAIDGAGKEHPAEMRSDAGVGEFRQLVGEFDLAPKQIEEFRVQTRSFEEVEVQGIALKRAGRP